jgi:hypothetical protein
METRKIVHRRRFLPLESAHPKHVFFLFLFSLSHVFVALACLLSSSYQLSCDVFQKEYEVYFRKNMKSVHKNKMRYLKSDFVGKLHTISL